MRHREASTGPAESPRTPGINAGAPASPAAALSVAFVLAPKFTLSGLKQQAAQARRSVSIAGKRMA